jgi:hypothetical protein
MDSMVESYMKTGGAIEESRFDVPEKLEREANLLPAGLQTLNP